VACTSASPVSSPYMLVKGPAAVLALLLAPARGVGRSCSSRSCSGSLMLAPGLDVVAGACSTALALLASAVSAFLLLAWLAAAWMLDPRRRVRRRRRLRRDAARVRHAARPPAERAAPCRSSPTLQGVVLVALAWIVADLGGWASPASVAGISGERASSIANGSAAFAEGTGTAGDRRRRSSSSGTASPFVLACELRGELCARREHRRLPQRPQDGGRPGTQRTLDARRRGGRGARGDREGRNGQD
jgi:hypothetical protein